MTDILQGCELIVLSDYNPHQVEKQLFENVCYSCGNTFGYYSYQKKKTNRCPDCIEKRSAQ